MGSYLRYRPVNPGANGINVIKQINRQNNQRAVLNVSAANSLWYAYPPETLLMLVSALTGKQLF